MSETEPITVTDHDGGSSVNVDVGRHPATEAIAETGHRPDGRFWVGLVRYGFPQASQLELDETPEMFSATGDRAILETLAPWLNTYLTDPDRIIELIRRAEADGAALDG